MAGDGTDVSVDADQLQQVGYASPCLASATRSATQMAFCSLFTVVSQSYATNRLSIRLVVVVVSPGSRATPCYEQLPSVGSASGNPARQD